MLQQYDEDSSVASCALCSVTHGSNLFITIINYTSTACFDLNFS